jgi:hypothetical protein
MMPCISHGRIAWPETFSHSALFQRGHVGDHVGPRGGIRKAVVLHLPSGHDLSRLTFSAYARRLVKTWARYSCAVHLVGYLNQSVKWPGLGIWSLPWDQSISNDKELSRNHPSGQESQKSETLVSLFAALRVSGLHLTPAIQIAFLHHRQ